MLDPQLLRNHLNDVAAELARRGYQLDVEGYAALESRRKKLQTRSEEIQAERNRRSRSIGEAKSRGEDIAPLLAEVEKLGQEVKTAADEQQQVQRELKWRWLDMPNIPDERVPAGSDDSDNVEIRRFGEPPELGFAPRDHVEIGALLDGMDFEQAAKIAGSRFAVLGGGVARLHRALAQFMLDLHIGQHGYREMYVPYVVLENAMQRTGQLPKFVEDDFFICDVLELFLVRTVADTLTHAMTAHLTAAAPRSLLVVVYT